MASNKLPESTVIGIIPQVGNLIKAAVTSFAEDVKKLLPDNEAINKALEDQHVPDYFDHVRTVKRQQIYFREQHGMVSPKLVDLPLLYNKDYGRHNSGKDQFFKNKQYVYISILDQLRQILNIRDVYHEIYMKEISPTIKGI